MGTDNLLKRSRHQPTTNQPTTNQPSTMNVNTYHCESPKSDGKLTSLIALSNGSTAFGTPATELLHEDNSNANVFHENNSNNCFVHANDAVSDADGTAKRDARGTAKREGQQNAMPVEESDKNSNFFPLIGLATTVLIGLATTALTFHLRNKRRETKDKEDALKKRKDEEEARKQMEDAANKEKEIEKQKKLKEQKEIEEKKELEKQKELKEQKELEGKKELEGQKVEARIKDTGKEVKVEDQKGNQNGISGADVMAWITSFTLAAATLVCAATLAADTIGPGLLSDA